jgi:fibronectin type 3 domain-containing protein
MTATVTVLTAQTITFANPGAQTVGTPLTLSATATSGLTVSFASTTQSVCTVSGTTATFLAAGTCSITATQAGNATYAAAAPVSQSFTVNASGLLAQTITFANPGTQAAGTPLTLVATASSGLPVSFTSTTTSVCTVSGTTATFLTAGNCSITASQPGNATYAAATPVSQSFSVIATTGGNTVGYSTCPAPAGSGVTYTIGLLDSSSQPSGPQTIADFTHWNSLNAGDVVCIYGKSTPYAERLVLTRSGSDDQHRIRVVGVNQGGYDPILTGKSASTAAAFNYGANISQYYEGGEVAIIGLNYGTPVAYLNIEGLTIQGATTAEVGGTVASPTYSSNTYSDPNINSGAQSPWGCGAAGINIIRSDHVSIIHNRIKDNDNGIFVNSNNGNTSSNILVEYNHIYGNGVFGEQQGAWNPGNCGADSHGTYTEAENITYLGNRFGALRQGEAVNLLKDRSSGLVVAYNLFLPDGVFEASLGDALLVGSKPGPIGHLLDLVESYDTSVGPSGGLQSLGAAYNNVSVYGNIFFDDGAASDGSQGAGNAVHFGGDQGNSAAYRKHLHYYNNTIVARRGDGVGWLEMEPTTDAGAWNNIFYAAYVGSSTPPSFNLLSTWCYDKQYGYTCGTVNYLSQNWNSPIWAVTGVNGSNLNPNFVSLTNYDVHIATNDPTIVGNGQIGDSSYPANSTTVPIEYSDFLSTVTRPYSQTKIDLGALGYSGVALISQTITFANPGSQTAGTPLTLIATASSGLPVSFTSQTTSVCTVNGTTATFLTTGTCTIQATQAGNASYAAATPVTQSFTVNAAIPLAPTGLTAAAGNAKVMLNWTAAAAANTYNVYRGTSAGGESATPIATGIAVLTYTDTSVINNTAYYYKVAGVSSAGTGPMSNEASATPSAAASCILTVTDTGVAEIDLSWTACSGATSYNILRSITSGGPYTTLTVSTGTSYQDFGLVSMQKYYYVIQAVSSAGANVESNEANAVFTSKYVSQDANGWTTVIPSPNSKQYYVSSSTGSDSTGNGTLAKPFASIKKAVKLIRPGSPDWILLKAGDVWYEGFGDFEPIGGLSADEPMVFTSYGTGPRPQMRFTDSGNSTCFDRFSGQTFSHFYFMGLECYDSRKDPSSPDYESSNGKASAADTVGFRAIDSGDDILVEDNYFHFLAGGLVIQYNTGPAPKNIRIRRNNITDMYAASGAHSQGAFLANITNLLVEDNLFDHNAWNDEAGIPAWIFNHHMYIVDSYMTTIRNNLMLRDESLSLKICSYAGQNDAFAGALIYNNLIFEGEVGIGIGYGASAVLTESAFTGFKIDNNILLQVDRDNPTGRGLGWGIDIQNVSESFFTNNIFTQFDTLYGNNIYAFNVDRANANMVASGNTIQDNLIYQDAGVAFVLDTSSTYTNIKIQNNTIQNSGLPTRSQVNYDPLMYEETGNSLTPYSFSGNTYYNSGPYNSENSNNGFAYIDSGNILDTYSQWLTRSGETGSQIKQITYPDPNRTLESYDASLGGPSALNPIYAAIRSQSRATWNPAYTAEAVNDYIRGGFNVVPLKGGVGNTITPPASVTTLSAATANASVTLNWTAPTGNPAFYIVYRGTTSAGENMVSPIATYVTGSPWTDTTAVNGSTYYYQVASMNAGGFGGLSNEASATPQSSAALLTPNVSVSPDLTTISTGAALSVQVTVTGSGATPTGSVTLSGGGYTSAQATLASGSYTFTIAANSLTAGTDTLTVSYGGDSNYQATTGSGTVTVTAPVPGAPAGLAAMAGNNSVSLTWEASIGASSYNIYRGTTANGESTTPIATGITAAAYADSTATNNTTYFYKVAAVNSEGTSELSNETSATPSASAMYSLPPDRLTIWNPGLNAVGGIPNYINVYATLSPSGGSDTTAIQNALDEAGAVATKTSPKVVYLSAGTYKIAGGPLQVPSYVVLRGAGPDLTKLVRDFKGSGADIKVKIIGGGLGGSQSGTNVATFVYSIDAGGTYTNTPQLITFNAGWDLGTTTPMRITFATGDGTNGFGGIVYTAGDIFTIHWNDSIEPFGDWTISHTGTGFNGLDLDHYGDPYGIVNIGSGGWADLGTSIDLTSDAVKGSNSVTVASAAGLAAGDLIHLDEINEIAVGRVWLAEAPNTWFSRLNRNVSQRMEIDHIIGNTIYFTTPFHTDFRVSQSAQISQVNNPVRYAGVEDIYAYGASSGDGGGNFNISNGMYSWIKHVEAERSGGTGAGFSGSFRSVIRDSYIHTAAKIYPASAEYMICVDAGSSDNLIENNIAWDAGKATVMRSSGGGNVFGYNYMDDIFISDPAYVSFIESGIDASHQTTPHFELFEGNQSFNFDSDTTHGNAFNIVAYRNHLTGLRRSSMRPLPAFGTVTSVDNHDGHGPRGIDMSDSFPRGAVRPSAHNYNFSLVGNVLGFAGMPLSVSGTGTQQTTAMYDMEENDVQNSVLGMWMLGSDTGGNWQAAPDPDVINSTLRDGNFDYVTNEQRWHGIGQGTAPYSAPANSVLPNSLYLTSKPAFFSANTWPWVDPTTGTLYTLPARARFDAGTPNIVP